MADTKRLLGGSGAGAGVCEGDVLLGKYRLERVLGEGGMGIVAQARHLQLDERVAIKFLLPEAVTSRETVARFAREARAAVKIKSEHVARVIDVGELETGAPYMVMEYLEGTDLLERVHRHGPLPIQEAVEFVLQACEAIAEAHSLGIIHRDLKPSNLFVVRRRDGTESAKVLDFGISKLTAQAGARPDGGMTRSKAMMGSPFYASPEQIVSARDVDFRTDVWGLGVVLYELLAGVPPFQAENLTQLCTAVMHQPAPRLAGHRPDVPSALEEVVNCCLQKNPSGRYPSVAELAAALSPFAPARAQASVDRVSRVLGAVGISSPDLSAHQAGNAPPPAGLPPGTQGSWGRSAHERLEANGAGVASAVLVVLGVMGIAAGAAWLLMRGDSEAEPAAASSPGESPIASAEVVGEAPSAASEASAVAGHAERGRVAPVASGSEDAQGKPTVAPTRPARVGRAARAVSRSAPAPALPTPPAPAPASPTPTPSAEPAPPSTEPVGDVYGHRK